MADTDILTAAEAAAALNKAGLSSNALLIAVNTAVAKSIDWWCGPVVQRTVTAELHDGGCSTIWLDERPVTSITSITVNGGTPLVANTSYRAHRSHNDRSLLSGRVDAVSGTALSTFDTGWDAVSVTYVAGRFADTASVDERFKTAARITLRNQWRQYDIGSSRLDEYDVPTHPFPTFALPKAAAQLLAGEFRRRAGIG